MSDWAITTDEKEPIIGKIYRIEDSRKGSFRGKIRSVSGVFAEVDVLEGKIHWASKENKIFNADPAVVNVRDTLCLLIGEGDERSN